MDRARIRVRVGVGIRSGIRLRVLIGTKSQIGPSFYFMSRNIKLF